ncbi:unnamed protein product, partial [Amoebophrya sp. A25]
CISAFSQDLLRNDNVTIRITTISMCAEQEKGPPVAAHATKNTNTRILKKMSTHEMKNIFKMPRPRSTSCFGLKMLFFFSFAPTLTLAMQEAMEIIVAEESEGPKALSYAITVPVTSATAPGLLGGSATASEESFRCSLPGFITGDPSSKEATVASPQPVQPFTDLQGEYLRSNTIAVGPGQASTDTTKRAAFLYHARPRRVIAEPSPVLGAAGELFPSIFDLLPRVVGDTKSSDVDSKVEAVCAVHRVGQGSAGASSTTSSEHASTSYLVGVSCRTPLFGEQASGNVADAELGDKGFALYEIAETVEDSRNLQPHQEFESVQPVRAVQNEQECNEKLRLAAINSGKSTTSTSELCSRVFRTAAKADATAAGSAVSTALLETVETRVAVAQ